jgi:hypothetical protein
LLLDDGRRLLFDVTHGRVELLVPEGSPTSHRYLTVDNEPWYGKADSNSP